MITKLLKYLEIAIYFTASKNEPAECIFGGLASDHNLYLDSGGNTEYCKEYGLAIDKNNILEKVLNKVIIVFQNKILKYKDMDQIMLKNI